jgi:hypothetical protein
MFERSELKEEESDERCLISIYRANVDCHVIVTFDWVLISAGLPSELFSIALNLPSDPATELQIPPIIISAVIAAATRISIDKIFFVIWFHWNWSLLQTVDMQIFTQS